MIKLDMKDAYFSVPLHQHSKNYVRFPWAGNLYQFECLCFGLSSAPREFTKLLKIPISTLRRMNIRLIIYLDDIIIMCETKTLAYENRDTTIYLLQQLGFVINLKKSILEPTTKIEFLGIVIASLTMTMSLPENKIREII